MVLYSVVLNKLQISENYGLMKLATAIGFCLLTLSRMEAGVRAWLLSCDVPPLPRRLPLPLTEKNLLALACEHWWEGGAVWSRASLKRACLSLSPKAALSEPLSQQGQHTIRVGVGQCISETMKITLIFSICKEVSFSTRLLSALLTAAVVGVKRETVGATGLSSPLEMGQLTFCKLLLMETQTQIFRA